eukprot:782106-Pyramimonas_sp.AAC.1
MAGGVASTQTSWPPLLLAMASRGPRQSRAHAQGRALRAPLFDAPLLAAPARRPRRCRRTRRPRR